MICSVALEITRKCNMNCEHCLRGNAQNKTMSRDIIIKALSGQNIESLLITGGEPSLAVQQIEDVNYMMSSKQTEVYSFYLVTNGKRIQQPFLNQVKALFDNCTGEKEMCQFQYSSDQYHRDSPVSYRTMERVKEFGETLSLGEYNEQRFFTPKNPDGQIRQTVAMGRGWGMEMQVEYSRFDIEYQDDEDEDSYFDIRGGMFYVNYKGNVLPSCDLSYEAQDDPRYIIGNVSDPDFNYKDCAIRWLERLDRWSMEGTNKYFQG